MDDLRWILSGVAVAIIAVIFFLTRTRKKEKASLSANAADDVPSFSANADSPPPSAESYWGEMTAKENASAPGGDGWVDSVGPVRVISERDQQNLVEIENEQRSAQAVDPVGLSQVEAEPEMGEHRVVEEKISTGIPAQLTPAESFSDSPEAIEAVGPSVQSGEQGVYNTVAAEPLSDAPDETDNSNNDETAPVDDVIAVYVLGSSEEPVLKGDKILSASYSLHLEHGDMKIFHRTGEITTHGVVKEEIQFSMANMLAPGWFDIENMNQLETRGLSFFMQVNLVKNPSAVLDEMLICAHKMSAMLGANLCSAQRQLLDEAYTTHLRNKVKRLMKQQQSPPQ
ncbi:hypothetical protein MNBD_GAMMA10-2048 [hydrothermal vent metagenome]|uniref:ZipA C-terminal FtsZ-binding domain-containing protein n=1 Tax=hydrothermal vent metagenome TaxID=652676 RepID=A0A3B0Y9W7_9ZZZZ